MRLLKEMMDLSGRVALVTGGAGHIGTAIVEALAELGAAVAVADREQAASQEVAERIAGSFGTRAEALVGDIADENTCRQLVRRTLSSFGGLDILVHCAAFVGTTDFPGWAEPFEHQSVAAWDAAMRVNLTAAFILVQEAAEALTSSRRGSVIFVSSIYGIVGPDWSIYEGTGMQNPAAYGATKAGLLQLVRHAATRLAPHVRVNAITPGGVWRQQPDLFVSRYKARTPLGRMASEEDFKGAVAYLASDLSAYVTGHNLVVDGGWTVW